MLVNLVWIHFARKLIYIKRTKYQNYLIMLGMYQHTISCQVSV